LGKPLRKFLPEGLLCPLGNRPGQFHNLALRKGGDYPVPAAFCGVVDQHQLICRFSHCGKITQSFLVLNRNRRERRERTPGFMAAMRMTYVVKDQAALSKLKPGDEIKADLFVDRKNYDTWLEDIQVSQARSGASSSTA
jgi:hypothetical protein